jgi:hypothetical protein
MKTTKIAMNYPKVVIASLMSLFFVDANAQGVAINETGAVPNGNAMLDVDAAGNDKGILIPRISSGQRAGIGGLGVGDEGLTVYDETTNSFWLWDGTAWVEFMMDGSSWKLSGNAGTTAGTDFIGTTDAVDWVIKTNNVERIRVYSGGNIDLSDNTLYTRDNAGNTYGIGYGVEGGTEYTIFTDNLIQFTESDGDTQVMTIEGNNNRVEMFGTTDASGTAGSGVLEIANALRIDGNEIITNTNAPMYIQNDNNGDLSVDGGTLYIDASTNRVGLSTTAPTRTLDVNGTVRIRGGGPATGEYLMAQNANGDATWSTAGYGLVPIGTIVAWHKSAAGVPGIPAGWVECNGGTSNGIAVPNLNGATTSKSGDASYGRFLRGNTTSGIFQTDQSNNLRWINHDDSGNGDTNDFLDDDGTMVTIRNYSTSGDRFQAYLEGVETRVTNMTVVWIMRTQ